MNIRIIEPCLKKVEVTVEKSTVTLMILKGWVKTFKSYYGEGNMIVKDYNNDISIIEITENVGLVSNLLEEITKIFVEIQTKLRKELIISHQLNNISLDEGDDDELSGLVMDPEFIKKVRALTKFDYMDIIEKEQLPVEVTPTPIGVGGYGVPNPSIPNNLFGGLGSGYGQPTNTVPNINNLDPHDPLAIACLPQKELEYPMGTEDYFEEDSVGLQKSYAEVMAEKLSRLNNGG